MSYHINGAHLSQDIEKYIISHHGKVQVNRTSKCAPMKWKVGSVYQSLRIVMNLYAVNLNLQHLLLQVCFNHQHLSNNQQAQNVTISSDSVEKTVLSYRNIASFDCILELISQLEAKRLVPSNICSYFERRKQQALPVKRVC